jgi:hypothetical protein
MSVRTLALSMTAGAALLAACGGSRHNASAVAPIPRGEYTTQVDGGLSRLAGNARGQGYNKVVSGPVYGRLSEKGTGNHQMDVVNGNDYALLGACDADCSNLDLRVYDASGTLLMQDVETDDTPVLTFTAHSAGRYRVEVVMSSCSRNPCFYGVQLMAK